MEQVNGIRLESHLRVIFDILNLDIAEILSSSRWELHDPNFEPTVAWIFNPSSSIIYRILLSESAYSPLYIFTYYQMSLRDFIRFDKTPETEHLGPHYFVHKQLTSKILD